jgi:hypothetical protein
MSDRDATSLLERLTGGAMAAGEDPRVAQFVRGVALGALVGAAIAGSTLWGRRRGTVHRNEEAAPPLLPPPAAPDPPKPPASSR